MFYIQIALAIAIYAAGYATAWKIEVKEVARLEASIESANQQSQATLSGTLPKISDTPYDQIHDEAGSYLSAAELSAGFDQLVLTKNPDQLAEDKHFILAWLNTIPPEQVQ